MAGSDSNLNIISRKEALEKGLTHYFTGKPCKYGHIAPRYVTSLGCRACMLSDEKRAQSSERSRLWYRKNRERQIQKAREWLDANPEKARARQAASSRKWWAKNPDKRRIYNNNRRSKVKGNGGSHTVGDIQAIRVLQRGRCAICSSKLSSRYHVDHIKPISMGGTNDPRNIQLLCKSCNQKKSFRDPLKHMRSLGRLL